MNSAKKIEIKNEVLPPIKEVFYPIFCPNFEPEKKNEMTTVLDEK